MNYETSLLRLRAASRIGIVRTDRLGDMVLTLPLARAIKQQFPNASCEVICRPYVAPLLVNCPVLDRVHQLNEADQATSFRALLREHRFDVLFFPRPVFREALDAVFARVPVRIGSAYRSYSPMFTTRIREHRKESLYHEAEYNVRMLSHIVGTRCETSLVAPCVDPHDVSTMTPILSSHGISYNDRVIMLHPGSGGSAREWDVSHFAELAKKLSQDEDHKIVITGTAAEASACASIVTHCSSALNLCSELTLGQLIALLSRAQLLVAHSTGVLHIAAALGRPVVGLYPNTPHMSARRWGPYSQHARVVSPPQQPGADPNDDMNDILVDDVYEECCELLQNPI